MWIVIAVLREAEAGKFILEFEINLTCLKVTGQPGPCKETLSQKNKITVYMCVNIHAMRFVESHNSY